MEEKISICTTKFPNPVSLLVVKSDGYLHSSLICCDPDENGVDKSCVAGKNASVDKDVGNK